jgi:uncharacterized protein YfaP (DUF2135 family)
MRAMNFRAHAGILFFFLSGGLLGSPTAAVPKIDWAPAAVSETISVGRSKTILVSFTSSEPISGTAILQAVPALSPLIAAVPSSFQNLAAGATQTVEISLSAPEGTTPGTYDGVLHLRQGRRTLAKPLAMTLVVEAAPPTLPVTIVGRVLFDSGSPVAGAEVSASLAEAESLFTLEAASQAAYWTRGKLQEAAKPLPGPTRALLSSLAEQGVMTTSDGTFSLTLEAAALPVRVMAEVTYRPGSLPEVRTAKWGTAEGTTLDLGTILIPNPQDHELPLSNSGAESADGSIRLDGLPPEVARLFARSYDPDGETEAFPGEFAEMGTIPLNSSVFLWIEALDANGNPVTQLSNAATLRARVPVTQWGDLEDINFGTDRIEVPFYLFNEDLGMWESLGVGWLEDRHRTILPEDTQALILDGTFPGELFAVFVVSHFSWMNVDYPFVGPWTLSRAGLERDKRNNDCFFKALKLAEAIAKSPVGHAAYAKVNNPGADLNQELADGQGPEAVNMALTGGTNARYQGESGGSQDIQLGNHLWNGCDTPGRKKDTILCLASAILHETAHWKDHVKKTGADTPGEEGDQLERDLFGGKARCSSDGTFRRDGQAVDEATKDRWLDPAFWANATPVTVEAAATDASPLEITISLARNNFDLAEPIPVEVTLRNSGSEPLQIFNRFEFEDHPLRFEITHVASGEPVPFVGPEIQVLFDDADFSVLQPGESIVRTFDLKSDDQGQPRYNLVRSGSYLLQAIYSGHYGIPETRSNVLDLLLNPGGSITGTVTDATNGQPLSGATIKALQNGTVRAVATTGSGGSYQIPELPPGSYTVEAQARGFLRSRLDDVQVAAGQSTPVNFSLSPFLARGELRLVLTWGGQPADLDSHLWLPMEAPYHVFYGRRGDSEQCPFAVLDRDDVNGFGPEAITISQRVLQGTYVYAIHNFSGFPDLATSGAQVQVFDSSGLVATIEVPTLGSGRFWKVLTIDGATGAISIVNELGNNPEPYPDTAAGCAALGS